MTVPVVAVLMATHNGMPWLPDQVDSILNQTGADVRLFVSDDASTDNSTEWVTELTRRDKRVVLLPTGLQFGSAALNFYRLLTDVDISQFDYVAFSDQDDVWMPGKIERAIELMVRGADAVSSSVMAFWPDGTQQLIDKAQPLQTYDFLFGSAGPGCSIVLRRSLAKTIAEFLRAADGIAASVVYHDWLCYAVCRGLDLHWVVDPRPSLLYRQHARNEIGANSGYKAALARYRRIASGWYRCEVRKIASIVLKLCPEDTRLKRIILRVDRGELLDRLFLALSVGRFRRTPVDRLVLTFSFITGLFWRQLPSEQ